MPQQCRICSHPERQMIEDALASGDTYRNIAARFNVLKDSVSRHQHNHMETAIEVGDASGTALALSGASNNAPSLAANPFSQTLEAQTGEPRQGLREHEKKSHAEAASAVAETRQHEKKAADEVSETRHIKKGAVDEVPETRHVKKRGGDESEPANVSNRDEVGEGRSKSNAGAIWSELEADWPASNAPGEAHQGLPLDPYTADLKRRTWLSQLTVIPKPEPKPNVHQAITELCQERGALTASALHTALCESFTRTEIDEALLEGIRAKTLKVRCCLVDGKMELLYNPAPQVDQKRWEWQG